MLKCTAIMEEVLLIMLEREPVMAIATNVKECLRTLKNGPLTDDNFDMFYVEFEEQQREDITKRLNFQLEVGSGYSYNKYIFAGYRGVGKSTELIRVSRFCQDYHTVFVDACDASGNGVSYTNLLVEIVRAVCNYVIAKGIVKENDTAFEFLCNYWNSEIEIDSIISSLDESVESKDANAFVNGEFKTKFGILDKLKLLISAGLKASVSLGDKYSKSTSVDEVVKTVISKNDTAFIEALNQMLDELDRKLDGKHLLIIIENLDRSMFTDLVHEVFCEHSDAFISIHSTMINTFPIYALHDPKYVAVRDVYDSIYNLGTIKIIDYNTKKYIPESVDSLKRLIDKRIKPGIIEDDALELAIKKSGGLIRDLFGILADAVTSAGIDGRELVSINDVLKGVHSLEYVFFNRLGSNEVLNEIENIFNHPIQQFITDELRELLCVELVLEYGTGIYVVHPVIIDYLADKGDIEGRYV